MSNNRTLDEIVLQNLYEVLLRNLYDLEPEDKGKLKKSIFDLKTLLTQFNIHVSDVPPTNPLTGSLWFDTNELQLKVYVINSWLYANKNKLTFLELQDTPSSYANFSNKILAVSEDEKGIVFKDMGHFLNVLSFSGEFHDTNNVYVNHNLNTLVVNYKVFDIYGYEFIPNEVRVVDENNVIINMIHPMSGRYIIFKY